MKAMILAAGLGTRLKPLTDDKPKALVELNGITLLERVITSLSNAGFKEQVINIHHFGDQIIDFLESKQYFGLPIQISDERGKLLDTGGGILKARPLLSGDDPFLVHNVDVLTNLDLINFFNFHKNHGHIATLAVKNRETTRSLLVDEENLLAGWRNNQTGQEKLCRMQATFFRPTAFSGIYVLSQRFFDHFIEKGKFSIMDTFLRMAADVPIMTYDHNHDYWFDLGRVENLRRAAHFLSENDLP
ncbi:MAG TPA: nucleotidyltransferase family protein [Bacteroidales bacterium]|nr:nucleotidyltransferase family protein [Bacteroidales bacterium]